MDKKYIFTSLIALISLLNFGAASSTMKINDLISNSFAYDGEIVTIEAEVIGELLERGEDAWINVNDGSNAIGVWISIELADKIEMYGDYDHVGDTLSITGEFHRDCNEHGGEIDIHAISIEVINPGYTVEHPFGIGRAIIAFFLFLIAVTMTIHAIYTNHKNRKPIEVLPTQE